MRMIPVHRLALMQSILGEYILLIADMLNNAKTNHEFSHKRFYRPFCLDKYVYIFFVNVYRGKHRASLFRNQIRVLSNIK